jgi:poly(beta-D-mannuronate) lyase
VSNVAELTTAIANAKPGDTVIMKNGTWHNTVIEFTAAASASLPVTLRAQTPGEVILDGTSKLMFSTPYLIVDGLFFKNGSIDKNSVISFNSDHCRLTNTAILDYNPDKFETKYYWVYFKGNNNRVDHCFFKGKSNMNPVMGNDDENARHNRVDHCYIKDIPYVPDANGREILRIWGYGHSDEMGDDGAYFTVEYNLFERAHGEGTEIVSLKSNYNIVRFNTVRASRGGIVSRRGKNNTIEGNFIFGEDVEGTNGIRVAGQNHRVINNYIGNVDDDGLRLIAGEYFASRLTDRFKPKKKELPKYI